MADHGFIPLVFWHPSIALIVLWRFGPVLDIGGDGLCPLLYLIHYCCELNTCVATSYVFGVY
jgi:hypothetical protein